MVPNEINPLTKTESPSSAANKESATSPISPPLLQMETIQPCQPLPQEPCGLHVVHLINNHNYVLDECILEQILMRDDIKDLPVVVVSIAGAFRSGKSFLLNFFLRYLTAPDSARNESSAWLGDEDKPLTGFSWRGGTKRHTTGIVMWSEPIVCNLPSGEKVAVLLMDTQGTFDNSSSIRDSSTIFALATLLSSVQIYNITGNIKEYDLMHLQLFTQYGKLIQMENVDKAFQELKFLIRDWANFDEYEYGPTGGKQYIDFWLEMSEEQTPEMRELRQHIRSCFETISCFLMPHPGFSALQKKFDGRLSEALPQFKIELLNLVPLIFASENLKPKEINGERVRARDLLTYFKSYMKIFNSKDIPTPMGIMKATAEAAMLSGVRESRELYESLMEKDCGQKQPSWPKVALNDVHNKAVQAARDKFLNKKTMGTITETEAHLAQLNQDLEKRLTDYLTKNDLKLKNSISEAGEKYKAYIYAVHGKDMLCLHPNDLDIVHNEAVAEAIRLFDSKRKQFTNVKDEERLAFLQYFQKELTLLQGINDRNNRLIVSEIRNNYSTLISNLCAKEPPLDADEFEKKHDVALADALKTLEKKRNRVSNYDADAYKSEMSQKILEYYTQMSAINRSKNRKALQQALAFYDNYMKSFWDPKTCCLHPADLESGHSVAKNTSLNMYHPNSDSDEMDYEKMLLTQIIDYKYRDWKDLNDSANKSVVDMAFNTYHDGMVNDCGFSGWWLLLIPYIVNRAKKGEYHKKNKEAALIVFYNQRRDTMNRASDPYFNDLVSRIDNAYNNF